MRNDQKRLIQLMAHGAIVISGMLIVLLVCDRLNNAMVFIDNDLTKGLMWALCILSLLNGALLLLLVRHVLSRIRRVKHPAARRSSSAD